MLRNGRLQETAVDDATMAELLQTFRDTLDAQGMASMDQYGDMLNWALPRRDGMSRSLHVFHPGFCSFSDQHRGTVHYHGGTIRGTILVGAVEHAVYDATSDPGGDRTLGDTRYRLDRHVRTQQEGTQYTLAPFVPHWLWPTELTLTYFEEEDNGELGDLVDPVGADHDDHVWEQADADALLPDLYAAIDARLERLVAVSTR